jgi:uncharacterized protein YbjQ (UPF0145 family)
MYYILNLRIAQSIEKGYSVMTVTTGLSGNEIYCLAQKGYTPGNIVVGNSVYSLGLLRGIGTSFKSMLGGELEQVTQLIEEGREAAYNRMWKESQAASAQGITGVSSELIVQAGNIEFLSIGSLVHGNRAGTAPFSSAANGQELFAQIDAGYEPLCFAFGNVAYAMGVGRGLLGALKTFMRGEIKEYSDMFNHTRHLALERIVTHARKNNANAVLGIQTSILPLGGAQEMLMTGTACRTLQLSRQEIVSSDLTSVEMWNLATLGYTPLRLLLGTSVYSLGVIGGISASLKSFVRGEITELTKLIYDARENALALINAEAQSIGADDVVGVKTYVYQLGGGLIEFLAIGTAVKKTSPLKTESSQLPPQVIIKDQETFYDAVGAGFNQNIRTTENAAPVSKNQPGALFFVSVFIFIAIVLYPLIKELKVFHL